MTFGDLLAQQPIGADDRGLAALPAIFAGAVDDEKMVADEIEGIEIALGEHLRRLRGRRALLVENAIAQALRAAHFRGLVREPHFEAADVSERLAHQRRVGVP